MKVEKVVCCYNMIGKKKEFFLSLCNSKRLEPLSI